MLCGIEAISGMDLGGLGHSAWMRPAQDTVIDMSVFIDLDKKEKPVVFATISLPAPFKN